MTITTIRTESGSVYVVTQRGLKFTLRANNVDNPFSHALQPIDWPIREPIPWPAQLGQRCMLYCAHFDERDHPLRMPGGGKHISRIQSLVVTQSEDA